ncbi:hypothetical protein BE20_04390 [Sorangium cellulosum]|nr:hypothetical protein BE20_04390 [Sorangium cellulosum]
MSALGPTIVSSRRPVSATRRWPPWSVTPPHTSGPRTATEPLSIVSSSRSCCQRSSNAVPVTVTVNGPASATHSASGRCTTWKCAAPLSRWICAPRSVTAAMRPRAPGAKRIVVPSLKRAVAPLASAST